MNPTTNRYRLPRRATIAVLLLLASSPAWAQQAAPEPVKKPEVTPPEDEVIQLSPFEVSTEKNEGYVATSSLAGSRLNTALRDISSPISVVTPQFLKDTGATKVQDILIYTTSTEVAGINGNFYGSNATDIDYARNQQLRPQNQTRVRGLFGADLTRDFWQTNVALDSYNIQGVEIQRGPNSVLYGLGSPAGIINYTLKTPLMSDNKYSTEIRVDNEGSVRGSIDLNQAVAPGLFALRLNGLDEKHKYRQDGKFEKNERVTVSPRWTPKMADSVYTQFTLNYERGRQRANQPNVTPPVDFIDNWYRYMGKYSAANEFVGVPANIADYFTGFNGAGNGNWYDQQGVVFGNPNSSAVGGQGIADSIRQRGGDPFGTFHGVANFTENSTNPGHILSTKAYYQNNPQAMAIINAMEQSSGRAFSGFTGWQGRQILDTSVFDYWNDDVAGPNNTTWNRFNTLNFSAVQTYMDGRAGLEFVYDKQDYADGYDRYVDDPTRIGIDINQYVRATRDLGTDLSSDHPFGTNGVLQNAALNPNFGRPYLASGTAAKRNAEMRENFRGTAFYKLNLENLLKRKNWLTRIVGEQTFTGLGSRQRYHHYDETWQLYNIGEGFGPYSGQDLIGLHYLGSKVNPLSATQEAGLGITGLNAVQRPPSSITAQVLDERNPRTIGQYAVVTADTLSADTAKKRLFTGGSDFKTLTTTRAFIWQSRFLDDTIVGLFGLRKDDFEKHVKGTLITQAPDARDNPGAVQGRVDPTSPLWKYDPASDLETSGTTHTYGIMVHSPEFINKHLPWGTRISLGYNQASNVNPSDVGFDVFRKQIPAQSGDSKDYTVLVSTLNDRVTLRATWYKTNQQFASGPGPTAGNIGESLNRTLNGIMVEASYTGNKRINTTPEFIVNKWFFGGNGASGGFTPGQWNNADAATRAAMLKSPLLVRAAAATWGDPTTHLNSNGSVVGQPTISDEEILYRKAWFEARSNAEWFRPLGDVGTQLLSSYQFRRVPNGAAGTGFTWAYTAPPAFKNTTDINTKGLELEATANLTKNWRVILNASKAEATNTNVMGASMNTYYTAMKAVAKDGFTFNDVKSGGDNWTNGSDYWHRTGFAQIDEWGDEGASNNHQMLGEKWVVASGGFGVEEAYLNAKAAENRMIRELRKWRFNVVSTYDFAKSSSLKGLGVGGAVRYQGKTNLGFYPKFIADSGVWVSDLDKPIPGPSEVNYDAWVYYRHRLTKKIDMTVQLNLRNLFSGKDLIPISSNPDGTVGQYRLGSTFGWELSSRFEF